MSSGERTPDRLNLREDPNLTKRYIRYLDMWALEVSGNGKEFSFSDYKDSMPLRGNEVHVETTSRQQPRSNQSKNSEERRLELSDCLYVFTDEHDRTIVYSDIDTQRAKADGVKNPIRAVQLIPGQQGLHIPSIVLGEGWEVSPLPRSAPVSRVLIKLHERPNDIDSNEPVLIFRESPIATLRHELETSGLAQYLGSLPLNSHK